MGNYMKLQRSPNRSEIQGTSIEIKAEDYEGAILFVEDIPYLHVFCRMVYSPSWIARIKHFQLWKAELSNLVPVDHYGRRD